MASKQATVDFILDQIAGAGAVSAKKMFGEYGIYCDGKIVALVCDDQFFVKKTNAGRELLGSPAEASPFPEAKPWFAIPGDQWDDHALLSELIKRTAAELPMPKPKAIKAAASSS